MSGRPEIESRPPTLRAAVRVAEVIGVAAAYFAVGRLSLLLAIPPGYATAVWPASGLALGAALLFGSRIWPGIALGSLAINVWTSLDATTLRSLVVTTFPAAGIGLGAALQAVIGALLVRRFVGYPTTLSTGRDVLTFLLLGGPVACLISATAGVTTLLGAGVIEGSDRVFHWWTWWVGDTIGVVMVAPLVVIWARGAGPVTLRRRVMITVPLVLAFALVVTFFIFSSRWERDRVRLEFARRTDTVAQTLRRDLGGDLEVLHSIQSFFASSGEVRRDEFRTFVSRLLARHPGIQAISWNVRVLERDRAAPERAARRDGLRDFAVVEREAGGTFVPAASRPEYVVVLFVEPMEGNERALGFDVASDPARRAALDRARDTGEVAASDPIVLVQERDRRPGLLAYLPVYVHGRTPATVEERRRDVAGYATAVFRITDMIASSLRHADVAGLRLRLFDETTAGRSHPLYDGLPGAAAAPGVEERAIPFDVGGRRWVLRVALTREHLVTHRSWESWSVLAGGMLFSGLLGGFLFVLTGRTVQLQATNAELRTEMAQRERAERALREAEERAARILAEALDAVITIDDAGCITSWNPQAEHLFGWTEHEVMGRRLSETIVPPEYREAHERGLAHFRATGEGPLLGRRLELTALRRDGATVPVELAITRVSMGGRVAFSAFLRDIGERKRAEAALAESVATFRLLFENNPIPMWVYDLQTLTFLEVNEAAMAHYGYSREQFLRMRISDIRPDEDVPRVIERVASFTPGTVRHAGVWRHRLRDGTIRLVDVKAHSIDFGGRPAALVVANDVTERERAEAGLARYAQRMRILHEIDQALIAGRSPEAVAGATVAPLRELLGLPRVIVVLFDEAAGEAEWLAAAGRRRVRLGPGVRYSLRLAGDLEALRRGEPQLVDVSGLSDSPEGRSLLASDVHFYVVVPLIMEGELMGGLALGGPSSEFAAEDLDVAREVARQLAIALSQARLRATKEASDRRFRALVEGSIQGLYITNAELHIRYANAALARMFGYPGPDALVGRSAMELYAPGERGRVEARARARFRDESVPSRYESQGVRADGTPIWLDLLVSRVDVDGEPLTQVTLVDITERKRTEEQLRQAQKMDAIGRLAGGVAHDFNNLLTVIMGRAQILLERYRPGVPESQAIELIVKTAERAARLTKQLLAFSRKQILEPRLISLGAVVEGLEPILRRLIGEDVDIVVRTAPDPGRVRADPGQLEQVVLNLVVNARDAMPRGGRLLIATDSVDLVEREAARPTDVASGPHVRLAVSDTGVGMDAATLAHLFEPFFTTKLPGKGTGLGLATVYGIVKQSGGYVTVESEPGRGSTFTVYLPRIAEPVATPDDLEAPATLGRGSETILLVEDEPDVRELAAEILAARGYTVLQASQSEIALETAARHEGPLHLLLTDVVMPGMSGRELATHLLGQHPALRTLFITGYTDDAMLRHGVQSHETALLQKPFTPDVLLRRVREVLG